MAKTKRIGQCKLCLQMKELHNSHLMPRAIYTKTRWKGMPNANPGFLTADGIIQTPHQVKDYVLCFDCEQLLNEKGEKYAMSVVKDRGRFPLLVTLNAAKMTKRSPVFDWYDKASTPTVDRDALGYFAMSVFWRAAAHDWSKPGHPHPTIRFGPYQEKIRRYLLGEAPFPEDMMLMLVVCTDTLSQNTWFFPSKNARKTAHTAHSFQVRGLNFLLNAGKQMPDGMKSLCFVSGIDRWILKRSCEEKVIEAASNLGGEAAVRELFS
jgi:hypothetical protein